MVKLVNMTKSVKNAVGWPVSDVKARLSEFVHVAEGGESVVITRHGRPVAALVGVSELERLERLKAAGPEGGLASLAGGWEDSAELAREIDSVRRSGTRHVSLLD